MIADIFELNGWNTLYLGANTPTGAIVDFCRAERAEVLALSATITPHVSAVREIISEARKRVGERLRHIIVGGHPFNVDPDLWQRIGADGWAREPGAVVELCK
jgi:methanogenic corrinoid protein MtbC1